MIDPLSQAQEMLHRDSFPDVLAESENLGDESESQVQARYDSSMSAFALGLEAQTALGQPPGQTSTRPVPLAVGLEGPKKLPQKLPYTHVVCRPQDTILGLQGD